MSVFSHVFLSLVKLNTFYLIKIPVATISFNFLYDDNNIVNKKNNDDNENNNDYQNIILKVN